MRQKIIRNNFSSNTNIIKINDDAISLVLSEIIQESSKDIFLHITTDDARMDNLQKQINFFAPQIEVLTLPAWDCLPYDRVSPKSSIIATRVRTLAALNQKRNKKLLVISTINSVLQKTIPRDFIESLGFFLKTGDEMSIDKLTKCLINNGYHRSPTANDVGEFAIRGSIVDIVNQNNNGFGYRLDFFGETLESIRIFDPLTQITSEKINEINFLPTSEVILNEESITNFRNNYRNLFGIPSDEDFMYQAVTDGRSYPGIEHFLPLFYQEGLDSLFSYFTDAQILVEDKVFALKSQREGIIAEYYQSRIETLKESRNSGGIYNPIEPRTLYLESGEFEGELGARSIINLSNFESGLVNEQLDLEIKPVPDFDLAGKSNRRSAFDLLKEFIQSAFVKHKIIISCFSDGSRNRIEKILLEHEIASSDINYFDDKFPKNHIGLVVLPMNIGFYNQELLVISEAALLGEKKRSKSSKKLNERIIGESLSLQVGELIVHKYHGIGKFDGLHMISAGGISNDFMRLIYGGSDVLFLPVEDINLITRYGADNPLIQLDRLGMATWKNRQEKVRKRIKVAAAQLIEIAAKRQLKKAPIFTVASGEYEEFKTHFGFVETDDQLKVIEEVEDDLSKGIPMDRLVCGDVGFGKTEVAMRAAYIAAKNETGKFQVAIITPTTLLCRQHFHNFIERFKETGLKIKQLSRMTTLAQNKVTKQYLEAGKIDIVIGTHSLLSKNIKFKNLGLVILDEEQHFGVAQKERLKELRNEVHMLTLSATPIPRTLQMSLSGVKELSIIATPPVDRLAIRSFVMPYDSVIVKEAILREYQRGGKIFFVVPKIRDIADVETRLKKSIPEVRIRVAHGQMAPSTLDEIMNDFYDGKFDVLLSTTIIESGIDISTANTIIVYKAEMFGLSQLYQLRGRVGRGKLRAYSYLMTSPHRKLTVIAEKKLEVMQTLDSLGAGFSIASHDMDIRGSGNILGDEQSGHIRETGVELYQDMLNQAIRDLKKGKIEEGEFVDDFQPQIKLGVSLLIPETYISDLALRLNFYKRIGNISDEEEANQVSSELIDRFGSPLPQEIENLIETAYLKHLCKICNIEKVESKSDGILISFKGGKFSEPEKLLEMIFSSKNKIRLQGHKILFIGADKSERKKLELSRNSICQIENLLNN